MIVMIVMFTAPYHNSDNFCIKGKPSVKKQLLYRLFPYVGEMSAQPPYGKSLLKCCFFSDENNGTGLKKRVVWPFREAKHTGHRKIPQRRDKLERS